ncbi:MAG: SH3 domain-containing protein [Clostridium sp.]|nr:SH3 domain-containing protein [Clostridium sp.]MCM1548260.1 SH3 domain-containing protein [Ruminococcus sp.]
MFKKLCSIFAALLIASFALTTPFYASADGSYKTWLQSDSRWGSKTLGGSGDTMAEIGCAVTALAIQVVHSGSKSESSFNPGTLVDYLNKNGGLDSEGNLYWGAVTGLVSSFTYEKRASFSAQNKSTITKELTSYINSGYYVIMSVEYDGHWVAIDTIKNGVVYMMDPAQNKSTDLFSYYNVNGMLQVRLYKGKNTPAKIDQSTTPTTAYLTGHYKTTDALNLRSSYSTSSNILLTIPKDKTVVVTRVYNNEWGQTEYNGKSGWIYLEYTNYTESSYTYKTGNYKCNVSDGVNMRSGIGTDKSVVCLVPYNATVKISSVSNNWGKATYNSQTGYICMEYLTYAATTTAATTTKPTTTTTTTTTTATTAKTTASTTTSATTAVTATLPVIKGDINRDGEINNDDVLALNLYLNNPVKLEPIELFIYDVNTSGTVEEIDAVYLMKQIKG